MQLRNDYALCAIDDEGAALGHHGNFTHVDFLLLDILDGLRCRFFVKEDQSHSDAQRNGIGDAAQLALFHIECRLAEIVAYVFEYGLPGVTDNREHRLERSVQTLIESFLRRDIGLSKLTKGIYLS